MAEDKKKSLGEKLRDIQTKLSAPKNEKNDHGNFNYRSAEQIYQAVKPFLKDLNLYLVINDEMVEVGGRVYLKATATLSDLESDESVSISAYAREAEVQKGMNDAQLTGSTSSYARKYALGGLFLIDDNKDPDSLAPKSWEDILTDYQKLAPRKALVKFCEDYGVDIKGVCGACSISNDSGDNVFKEALIYAVGLARTSSEGGTNG